MSSGICVPVIGPSMEEARAQLAQACKVADLVEIRADLLRGADVGALIASTRLPVLIKTNGGPVSLDAIRWPSPVRFGPTELLSYHNFEAVPDDLKGWLKPQTGLHKLACYCHTGVDALRLARLASPTTIAVGMGPAGLLTRVLAPLKGSPFTYAALTEELMSAPGQPTVDHLKKVYGFERLGPATKVLGLIGARADQSPGVDYHNRVFQMTGIDAVYLGIQVPEDDLGLFFQQAAHFAFVGLSVTMPHKETVRVYLDEVDAVGKAIGAINTIAWRKGRLCGTNTDGIGALNALGRVAGKKVVVIGAGGAGRAIVFEALRCGAEVTVMNRTPSRAEALAREFGCSWTTLGRCDAEIVVQATSAGMAPYVDAMPIPAEWIPEKSLVMEIITRPEITAFMKAARSRGCRVIPGSVMFENQARAQHKFWFSD